MSVLKVISLVNIALNMRNSMVILAGYITPYTTVGFLEGLGCHLVLLLKATIRSAGGGGAPMHRLAYESQPMRRLTRSHRRCPSDADVAKQRDDQ